MTHSSSFLFMADAHIKSRTWVNFMGLQGDAYFALDRISDQLDAMPEAERPDTILIGGDWFDSNRPGSSDIYESLKFLKRFSRIVYIRGNHDSVIPSYLSLAGCTGMTADYCELDMTDTVLPGSGARVFGIPYTTDTEAVTAYIRDTVVPAADHGVPVYLLMHAGFSHLFGISGAYQFDTDEFAELLGGHDIRVLNGHIHTREMRSLGAGYIYSPGSLYPLSFDRRLDVCGATVIDAATGAVTPLDVTCRGYYTIDGRGRSPADIRELLSAVKTPWWRLPSFVRLTVDADSTERYMRRDYPDIVLQAVRELRDGTEAEIRDPGDGGITLAQAVRDELMSDEDLADMAVALLQADDPVALLSEWLDFWKVERIA